MFWFVYFIKSWSFHIWDKVSHNISLNNIMALLNSSISELILFTYLVWPVACEAISSLEFSHYMYSFLIIYYLNHNTFSWSNWCYFFFHIISFYYRLFDQLLCNIFGWYEIFLQLFSSFSNFSQNMYIMEIEQKD